MFTQAITSALRSHMEVQLSFVTDLSRKMYGAVQKISTLNLRLAQDLIEDMNNVGRQLMEAKDAGKLTAIASTQLHPATEKLQRYQQELSKLIASTNEEMAKTAESHLPEASRTAVAVADEIVRTASEETEKATQRQRSAIEQMNEVARHGFDGLPQAQTRH